MSLDRRREDAVAYLSAVIGQISLCSDRDLPSSVEMAAAALRQLAIGMRLERDREQGQSAVSDPEQDLGDTDDDLGDIP